MCKLPTPLWIEVEPGHCVDLTKVFEFDDNPDTDEMLIFLPAPALGSKELKVAPGDGPHALMLSGESCALARRYFRYQMAQSRAAFAAIEHEERKELFSKLDAVIYHSRAA